MLFLSRSVGERLYLLNGAGEIIAELMVVEMGSNKVRLGITAAKVVGVQREENLEQMKIEDFRRRMHDE